MTVIDLLEQLQQKQISLSITNDELVVKGNKLALSDSSLLSLLRENKQALIELIKAGRYIRPRESSVQVPPNLIPSPCTTLTPEMLPLVELSAEQIDRIVSQVPGGAGNVQDIYPLAPLQEGILFHHLMAQQSDPYLLSGLMAFDSRERLNLFLQAMQAVVDRHDILRTAIFWEGLPEPVQVVLRKAVLPIEEVLLDADAVDAVEQLRARFDPRRSKMDLQQAPLLRLFTAYDARHGRWLLLTLNHHMVGDHASMDILQEEILACLLGKQEQLPASLPFRNLVAQARLGISREEHEAFFRKMLGDVDEPTAPFGLLEVQGDGTNIVEAHVKLEATLSSRMRERARRLSVSVASLCHLAWAQVLARLTGREDAVFGTVLFGRMEGGEGADRIIGPFINTLPVRLPIGNRSVLDGIRHTHSLLAEVLHHEHASLALAQRCSAVQAPAPLFSSLLNYRYNTTPLRPSSEEALQAQQGIEWIGAEERTNYPFDLSIDDFGDGLELTAQVDASVDAVRVCALMQTALTSLVTALEYAPETPLRSLDILPAEERQQVLYGWNETRAKFPEEKCVHQLFEEQVARTPEATALVFEERELSYRELNRQANRLAHYLRKIGVKPDDRVALCVERGFEMIVALLAVLKAGGAYVPLDPAYPAERLRFMLEDSAPVALLTQTRLHQPLPARFSFPVLLLDGESPAWNSHPDNDPDAAAVALTPDHLAYIIYTSGSTGTPKGVMVQHRSVVNRMVWMQAAYGLNQKDTVLHKTTFTFDVSVWEILASLLAGSKLVLARPQGHMDPAYLVETIRRNKITMVDFVPPMLQAFLEHADAAECSSLVHVICGGEAISAKLARWCRERLPHTSLHNSYGPTETTVDAAEWTCPAEISGASVPIGRPIANTRIYILDAHGEPAPVGVAGELYIGGASVARGYLNRPELTAERFLKDPFISESAARMYKTGDLGRWLADGNIEFLGRNDSQVKIRGFRIELGEIEARLAEHPAIREAVVLAREDQPGETRLAAYYVPVTEDEDELGVDALREHLSKALPEYMVPAAYMRLEALPLTPNGKLDRKALPAPDDDAYSVRGYEEPQGEIETLLARIWVEVLKLDRVGRHDNFFHLGGHSLLAVTLIERMRRSGVQADVRTLFATPTLAELAAAVAGTEPQVQIPPNMIPAGCTVVMPEMLPLVALSAEQIDRIVSQVPGGAGNVQDIYPLAPLQEGILFHHLMAQQGDPYLLSSLVGFDNRERLDVFLKAMQAVVDRHDILRTAIFWEGLPEPVQVVLRKAILSIEEVLLDADAADAAEQLYAQFDPRRSRIDLHQAPLLRVFTAYDSRHNRWLLLTLQHHLAGDHTAADVLQEEIQAHLLGRQEQLPAPLPFRNFVAQARLGISREEHEAFFRKMLGDVDEPTAPFGLLEVRGDGTGIAEAPMEVDASLSSRMREHARRLGVSVASLCHLAWALVLARITGREDVVFGTMLFGRMQSGEGADRVMGLFINLLPLRIQIGGQTALDSVRRTQILLAELLRHEHASLALAQRCSAVQAPAPLFSAPLNYRHVAGAVFPPFEEAQQALQGIEWIRSEERTNYPFGISVDDLGDGFRLVAQVDVSIDPTRVCAFMHTALASLITALDQAPERPLRSLDVLPAEERQQVLYGWNNTATEYPSDRCLHQLFEEQVERAPEGTALVFEDRELSYEELNRQSNRLAHHLRELGIQPDDRVAICVERGFDMIVSLLAVLKAGGAYVPLDPAYPAERLRFMLDDSGPVALLTQTDLRHLLPQSFSFPILLLGHESPAWNGHSDTNPDPAGVALTPNHLAYVIYTSGSTGIPKGVMVQHGGLVNLVLAQIRAFALDGASRVLQFASFSFDACASEIFTSICQGASLHLVAQEDVLSDPTSLFAQTGKEITHATLTPAVLATFPKDSELGGLSTLVVAGDVLPDSLAERWKPGRRLINAYGPTEATVCATLHICDGRESRTVPIGRPIANMRIYILNGRREPVPVGVVGELYIGGAGVARGYLNQPELTAERFLTDPFISEPGARMYKTGDLGRWLPDGNIEFLGRNDFQVKLRGFRIELGEIEARLAEHPGIRAAVVLAREDQPGDKRLVAYYVPVAADQDELSVDALRAHLSQALPEYMVPAAYVRLEALPLTPNGKLDRNALQAPEADHHSLHGYEEPRGETEILLARIWIELLAVDRVGRHDNFFDLGGHSLLAIQLISRIQQALDLEMEISDIFTHPSLEELADSIVTRQLARFESEELASALRLMQSS